MLSLRLICVENGMKNEENVLTSKLRSTISSCDTKNRHRWFDGIAHCLLYRGMKIHLSKTYGMPL
nr:hypothetical protein I308_02063 [Cryptococcus tetragattii IND107]